MADDPRTPLLGHPRETRVRKIVTKLCNANSWRRRLPITIWLPKYSLKCLLRDVIAGITVGLTSIPQGIAYAIIAGLPPQVGLYSSIFPGYVYMLFGSCKDVTVGPTAILAALLAKYVAKSVDFAYLAAFLSGCIILLLGILQVGFLLDFISKPVISGFTTAAALQIAASQLKSLFRISGSSGDTFIEAIVNFVRNIKTVHLWDSLLGIVCIALLLLLKRAHVSTNESSPKWRINAALTVKYVVRARNALVVFGAAILVFVLFKQGLMPVALTGKIEGGLPHFGPPPFSTVVNNQTVDLQGMVSVFGAEGLVMPLVAIMESIAIAKAFAGSTRVDNTQEMIAIGACNLVSSFAQCMPATGSFTRTALNHASGVLTPAGAFFKATLVLLAVTLLAEAFYFIPRATLAAIIIVAMSSIMELSIIRVLWRNSKLELAVYCVTVVTGVCAGLEYGILAGALADVVRILASEARPRLEVHMFNVGNVSCACVWLPSSLRYMGAGAVARALRRHPRALLVLRGDRLTALDVPAAQELICVMDELQKQGQRTLLWNFSEDMRGLLQDLQPALDIFVTGHSIDQHVLALNLEPRELTQ